MSTCQSWLFFYFSLCKCNINSHHSHHGAIIINYLHNWTTSSRLPWKQKGGAWCNGWANTHLTYMKNAEKEWEGEWSCWSEAVTCKLWLCGRVQTLPSTFLHPLSLQPLLLKTRERHLNLHKPQQNTVQIKEKDMDLIALMDQKLHSVCACVHVWGWWGVWHSTVILIGTIQSVPGLNRLQLTLSALNVS